MTLFANIKNLRDEAFKSGDKFLHSVLTNVFSDANPVGAAAANGATPDDTSVVAVVKKHLKGVVETLEIYAKNAVHPDTAALKQREKEILESLLPKQLSIDELKTELANGFASLKDWMAHLKTNFAGLYDGKAAKQVFEQAQEPTPVAAPLTEATPVGDTLSAPVQGVAGNVAGLTPVDTSAPGVEQSAPNSPVAEVNATAGGQVVPAAPAIDDTAPSSTEPVVANDSAQVPAATPAAATDAAPATQ